MKNYSQINNITAWFTFLIASIVYIMTIEPTASFWDCGEFITCSYKLEVGHPPGAPFFMLVGRFFTMFAFSPENVALMINILSAMCSSFTILFLFWTISHISKRIITKNNKKDLKDSQVIAIMGSSFVGSMAYTFSDTFWFSAVEGEVYAMSSLFTALVFWAILKWEDVANEKQANRWIILIAYLMGLSIGVHLLNLLAIPAIVFVYYFKKYKISKKGIAIAFSISILILGTIQYGIIPQIVNIASKFELLFVNVFGMPYNSGIIFYVLVLFSLIIYGLKYTIEKKKVVLNTILLSFTVILIAYSSFSLIVIRSLANPPMDQNNPDDVFSLLSYLNREQYGSSPLLFGHYYNAPMLDSENGNAIYIEKDGKYKLLDYKPVYKYDRRFETIFPRMYSGQESPANHVEGYKRWGNIKGKPIKVKNRNGEEKTLYKPTFSENLKFFFNYQVGFMYWRYFLWNFAGRQNDIQGSGEVNHGNWISGIPVIDNNRLSGIENMPEHLKNNKAHNEYYFLPLILGLIGLIFHYNISKKSHVYDFWVILLLFIFTGLAIIIYTNQVPYQPRERDYAYAGSFYAFAIWIGIGVFALYDFLSKKLDGKMSAIIVTFLSFLAVPTLMAKENWDDHDRSDCYTARDFAKNYLNSCQKNAVLFTNGDNDTFPLWYVQEVENYRTDVRVINLSYFNTDWYIDQSRRQNYEGLPIKYLLKPKQYEEGNRDVVYLIPKLDKHIELKKAMEFVADDTESTRVEGYNYIPTKKFFVPVDSAKVVNNGTVSQKDANKIVNRLEFDLSNKGYLRKAELMVLDMLASNNWERPIYFAITVGRSSYLNLEKYFQLEGLAYRIVPIENNSNRQIGSLEEDLMFDNMMNKFVWGGIDNPEVYLNENNRRMMSNFRNNFARLARKLAKKGKKDSVMKVLERCELLIPNENMPYNYYNLMHAEIYYQIGEDEKAKEILEILAKNTQEDLDYYFSIDKKNTPLIQRDKEMSMAILQEIVRITGNYKKTELVKRFRNQLMINYEKYQKN